jgi:hypothetical protein
MTGWWGNVMSSLRCGKFEEKAQHDRPVGSPDLISTREVSDGSSSTSDEAWLPIRDDWNVQETRKSQFLIEGEIPAMIPFTLEQGEIMQRLRSKALEICKYNGAHIRDTARYKRLVLNNKEVPKKRIVALHPSVANLVDISKTTSVDALPPETEKRKRRRNTLANTVPVVYENDSQNRVRAN